MKSVIEFTINSSIRLLSFTVHPSAHNHYKYMVHRTVTDKRRSSLGGKAKNGGQDWALSRSYWQISRLAMTLAVNNRWSADTGYLLLLQPELWP